VEKEPGILNMRVDVDMVDTVRVECADASDDAVDLVTFGATAPHGTARLGRLSL
jgi:hypothetical protein